MLDKNNVNFNTFQKQKIQVHCVRWLCRNVHQLSWDFSMCPELFANVKTPARINGKENPSFRDEKEEEQICLHSFGVMGRLRSEIFI